MSGGPTRRPAPTRDLDDPAEIAEMVRRFYQDIAQDDLLGPIFNDAVEDWAEHLAKLTDFWSSVMLTSGRYKGQPVPAHARHRSRITPALFDRWLAIWTRTTDELMELLRGE